MNEISMMVLKIIVAVAVTAITGFLIPLLKNLVSNIKDENVRKMIESAVQAAEQTIKGSGMGPEKKEEVLDFVSEWLAKHKMNISPEELDQLIESAVFAMNNNKLSS